jgi:hypothetical protein
MPCSSASARHFLANSFASGLSSSSEKGVMFSDTHTCRNSAARVVNVGSSLVRQLKALAAAVIHDSFFCSCHAYTPLPPQSLSQRQDRGVVWSGSLAVLRASLRVLGVLRPPLVAMGTPGTSAPSSDERLGKRARFLGRRKTLSKLVVCGPHQKAGIEPGDHRKI